jgi:putative endonuclease
MWWRREPARTLGQRGEDAAARYLIRQGYRILERNRYLGRNEIDIIAQEGDTIAFVEVRTRAVLDEVPPEDSVGPTKQRQLRKAAQRYIALYGDDSLYYRFDIVAVILPEKGKPTITLYRDAFDGA